MSPADRRIVELDLLRAALVIGQVFFHSARVFSLDAFYVSNGVRSLGLSFVVAFAVLWGMPLLFLISGQTAWMSLATHGCVRFVRERVLRLLVPFAFGLLFLVPPQVYLLLRGDASYHGGYLAFLQRFFRVVPALDWPWLVRADPRTALFEASHLYFLYFLFSYSVLLVGVRALARGGCPPLVHRVLSAWWRPSMVLWLGLPVGAVEAWLGSENYGGWNRYAFLAFFLLGAWLAISPSLRLNMGRHLTVALALAVPLTALGFWVYAQAALAGEYLGHGAAPLNRSWRLLKGLCAWWWVLVFYNAALHLRLGQGGRDGLASRRWQAIAAYWREAALPFYLLHHPIVIALAYPIVRLECGVLTKWVTLSLAALLATLGTYEVLVRRVPPLRFLLGMRTGERQSG